MSVKIKFADHDGGQERQANRPHTGNGEGKGRGTVLNLPRLSLEIVKGKTKFPVRPVDHSQFTIGSSSDCDLRLGPGFPSIHSIIEFRGQHAWIQVVSESVPLLVNGDPIDGEWLRNGDYLEVGPVALVARLESSQEPLQIPVSTNEQIELSEHTAEELVDALEQEMSEVEQFEENQELLARSMFEQARREKRPLPAIELDEEPARNSTAATSDLQKLTAELSELVRTFDLQTNRMQAREQALSEAADSLLKAQQEMMEQIASIKSQMEQQSLQLVAKTRSILPPETRAIA